MYIVYYIYKYIARYKLIGLYFSACNMNNTRKANYQYEHFDFMVKNPSLNECF